MPAHDISPGGRILKRAAFGALVFIAALFAGIQIAHAAEIIPALGLMRVNGTDQTRTFGSVALRGSLLPAVRSEVGIAYRSENSLGDQMKMRMWPVTASLWLTPLPGLYAGGGVGWYL